jgi:hypothetical protein
MPPFPRRIPVSGSRLCALTAESQLTHHRGVHGEKSWSLHPDPLRNSLCRRARAPSPRHPHAAPAGLATARAEVRLSRIKRSHQHWRGGSMRLDPASSIDPERLTCGVRVLIVFRLPRRGKNGEWLWSRGGSTSLRVLTTSARGACRGCAECWRRSRWRVASSVAEPPRYQQRPFDIDHLIAGWMAQRTIASSRVARSVARRDQRSAPSRAMVGTRIASDPG